MRRFIAYLIMLLTIVGALVFNTQAVLENKVDAMEFGKGTELVYSLAKRDTTLYPVKDYPNLKGENLSDIDIQKEVMERLDTASVRNADVKIVTGTEDNEGYQLRVALSPLSETELSNVKQIIGKTGTLSVCTIDDAYCQYASADQFFNNDSIAEVTYSGTTPYPTLNIKNTADFDTLKTKAEEAAKNHTDTTKSAIRRDAETGSDTTKSDENAKKLFLWVNKTSEDTYDRAFGTNNTVVQADVKAKMIANLSVDNYSSDKKQITITTDLDGKAFTISTARAMVNSLNATDYGFDISYLYSNSVSPTFGTDGLKKTYLACGIALIAIIAFFIAFYGLAGITASVSMLSTLFLTFILFSALGFEFSVGAIAGLFVVTVLSVLISVNYFERVKQELKKGRDLEKANKEGYHKAFFPSLDVAIAGLETSLFSFLIAQGQLKIFFGVIMVGTIVGFLLTDYLDKWMIFWLTKDAKANLPFFGFAKKAKSEKKPVTFVSAEKKHPSHFSYLIVGIASALLLGIALPVGYMMSGNDRSFFADANDYSDSYTLTIDFKDDTQAYDPLSTKSTYLLYIEGIGASSDPSFTAYDKTSTDKSGQYAFGYDPESAYVNVVEKSDADGKKYFVTYFTVTVDQDLTKLTLANGSDTPVTVIANTMNNGEVTVGDTTIAPTSYSHYMDNSLTLGCYVSKPTNITHDTNSFFLVIFLLSVFAAVYVFVRYGLCIALTDLTAGTVMACLSTGLLGLLRIPYNSYTGFALLAVTLLVTLLLIPLLAGNKETLKEEGLRRTATFEQRAEIANQTAQKQVFTVIAPVLSFVALGVALFFIHPELYGLGIASVIFGVLILPVLAYFALPYYYLLATHISFRRLREKWDAKKAKRHPSDQKPKADKDGVVYVDQDSPHETIIPGMNDFKYFR
jgi:protein-export membrane protein SecD